jgi:hypothetical protein
MLAAIFAFASAQAGEFDYGAYKASSLAGAVAEHHINPAVDYQIEAGNFKYAVIGTYTGQYRETVAMTKELIIRWAKSLRHPKEYETLFDHEVEVESGGKKYWLPIQNPMVQSFATEVREGSPVKLYIMLMGSTKDGLVFAINEFQVQ